MQELGNRKIANVFSMSSGLSVEDFGWGTATFHKMVSLHDLAGPVLADHSSLADHIGHCDSM